jgi:glycosyltransferase involved in cell wall biosynthesis
MTDGDSGRVTFVIHDLNSWGGQDRVTLEISGRLSREVPVDVHSFTCTKSLDLNTITHHRIRPHFTRPVILKSALFHGVTFFKLRKYKKKTPGALIHAAGACALISDVIQVHFVHRAWDPVEKRMKAYPTNLLKRSYHWMLRRYDLATERLTFRPSRRYIAVSKTVADELKTYYPELSAISVVYPGVDPEFFAPAIGPQKDERAKTRKLYAIAEDESVALFIGSYARKGLAAAIEALAILKRDGRMVPMLVAVGAGDEESFRNLAILRGVGDRVRLLPPSRDIRSFYRMADFFLLPTLYEPFGMVVLEAMSCALTPIVSKCAGVSELIQDGVDGFILENPEDASQLAYTISRLSENPDLRAVLGAHARIAALNQSWDRVAERYAQALWPDGVKGGKE